MLLYRTTMHWLKPRKLQQIKTYTALFLKRTYTSPKPLPILTLFTKDPCPLCDEAKEVLEPFKDRFVLQEVDITLPENKVWCERYKYDIPVFHLNGQFLMMHRVHTGLLEKKLASFEQQG
ncbi:glutaredoxin-like protein C5orf63 homolog isoform X2 [Amia ocellicauda]|uniref:glutaredoxin-like protein C5orf63 homolog isoform X2 n=1 Tax=Amia ocellicauda TaxID=2972642 RepID=UPI003463F9CF